ncbi:MAG: right-handed parallel beta-helix repeat-containing protein [Tahibacter sp.]
MGARIRMERIAQVFGLLLLSSAMLIANAWAGSMTNGTAQRTGPAALVPVVVRVEGLGLGSSLQLHRGSSTITASANDPYTFPEMGSTGTALDLQVSVQPLGQTCAVSELAPATVAPDSAPVFVRCRSDPGVRVTMPTTLPQDPLSVMLGDSALRPSAYPGIPYESRPGVLGGIFPYEFRLNAITLNGTPLPASSVSLDFRRGTVRFTPASTGTYALTVEIRDSAATQAVLVRTFTIQSALSPFLFVASGGQDSPGRGSLALPFHTPAYALAQSTPDQVIVLRKGTYAMSGLIIGDTHARQFMAYPDEVVLLDHNYSGDISVRITTAPSARFEGFDHTRVQQYGFVSDPSLPGLVIRHARFLDGREGATPSENPGFIHGWGGEITRHRLLIQDCDFGPYQEVQGTAAYATTLFDAGDSLIENNQVRIGTAGGFHDKDNSLRNTYRENYIESTLANANFTGIRISGQYNADKVHIHHNLFINSGVGIGGQCLTEGCYIRDQDVHNNTMVNGGVLLRWGAFNPDSFGIRVSANILSSGSVAPYLWWSCLNTVPPLFSTQFRATRNRIESTAALALRDGECGGSAMNMSWPTWQNTYGLDTSASGSVVSSTSILVGQGTQAGLALGDARRPALGHLYLGSDSLFANGFQ